MSDFGHGEPVPADGGEHPWPIAQTKPGILITHLGVLGSLVLGDSLTGGRVAALQVGICQEDVQCVGAIGGGLTEIDQVAAARGAARRHCLGIGLEKARMASILEIVRGERRERRELLDKHAGPRENARWKQRTESFGRCGQKLAR